MKNLGDIILRYGFGACLIGLGLFILRYGSTGLTVTCESTNTKTVNCVTTESFLDGTSYEVSRIHEIQRAKVVTIQASLTTDDGGGAEKIVNFYRLLLVTDERHPSHRLGKDYTVLADAEAVAQQINTLTQSNQGQPVQLEQASTENPMAWFGWGAILLGGLVCLFLRTGTSNNLNKT